VIYQAVSFLAVGILLFAVISIVYVSWRNGISPMPSSRLVRREVANELNRPSDREAGLLVEAGSGWGTLTLHIANHCPDWRIIGIENSLIPLWTSRLLVRASRWIQTWARTRVEETPTMAQLSTRTASVADGYSVSFERRDLYNYPYTAAQCVVCYLYPGAMKRLSPILRQRLAPGAQIISVCFALPDWEPDKVIICKDLYRTPVYVYSA
jgi:hypothetical protein